MLKQDQVDFYNENGYLKVDQLFTSEETEELASDMVKDHKQLGTGNNRMARSVADKILKGGRPANH